MRILHVVHQYLPRWVGGVEIYTHGLTRALEQRGHTTAIFVRENKAGDLQTTIEAGVSVYRWQSGAYSEMRQWLAALGDSATHLTFQRVLDEFQPTVVHLQHLLGLPASLVASVAKRRIPMVMTLHDYGLLCANTKLLTSDTEQNCRGPRAYINCAQCGIAKVRHSGLRPFAFFLAPAFAIRAQALRTTLRHIKQFIAPTEFVKASHARIGSIPLSAIQVIDYGIDLPTAPTIPIRPSGPLRVAFIGSVARLKGVHLLISAFNTMPAEAELRIAGDLNRQPDYVAELRSLAKHPKISFLGACARSEVETLLDWADLVAVPSIWYEVSPLVIHEAWARARPVMVGDFGSLAHLVEPDVNGWLIHPPQQPSAWAEALQDLHTNRAKLKTLQAQVRAPKSFVQHVTELERVYSSLFT
jgi:glycosyltransferase involved in cell wall biosynthesis